MQDDFVGQAIPVRSGVSVGGNASATQCNPPSAVATMTVDAVGLPSADGVPTPTAQQ